MCRPIAICSMNCCRASVSPRAPRQAARKPSWSSTSGIPQLVLMDVRMPGMGGLEAVRRLRESGSKTVIIAVTASSLAEAEEEARDAGADAFVRKPYQEGELLAVIGERLGVRYVYGSSVPRPSARTDGQAVGESTLSQRLSDLPRGADRSVAGGGDRGPRQAARIPCGSGGAILGSRFGRDSRSRARLPVRRARVGPATEQTRR